MILSDLRNGFRVFRRDPGFAAFAIITISLGIGTSAAMFSVVNALLLRPVPFADPEHVLAVATRFADSGRTTPRVSGGDWDDLRRSGIFEASARYFGGEVGLQLRERAEFAGAYFVSPGFFRVFDAIPVRGRVPRAGEMRVAVVSSGFADRALGGVDHAVGHIVRVDTQPYEVIGVMPPGFNFPLQAGVWMAAPDRQENLDRTSYRYRAVARIAPGVTLETTRERLNSLARELSAAHPGANRTKVFDVIPLRDQIVQGVRSTLLLLSGAVLLVLLVSCANVAHLLLARAVSRSREFAVRAAAGATRLRILAQLLIESAALGICGGVVGAVLAHLLVEVFVWVAPAGLPRVDEIRVNSVVLAFGICLSLLCAVIFGLAPAFHAFRIDIQEGLRGTGRGTPGKASARLRNALVVTEVALSFTLAVSAGLLARSFVEIGRAPLGFDTENILVAYAHMPANSMPKMRAATRFFEEMLDRIESIPGVRSAAAVMGLPTGRYNSNGPYFVEGRDAEAQNPPSAGLRLASPRYFSTMGIPLLRGRDFAGTDQYDAPFVAIISDSLARRSFPGENPIGKRIRCVLDSQEWMTIVGVAGDVRSDSPASTPGPELYMPFQQHPFYANEMQLVMRATGTSTLQKTVERMFRERSADVALRFTTMEAMLSDSVAAPRFRALLIACFASVALLLAMAGIYGLMSYAVARRTAEIGMRMALGASPQSVAGLILTRAAALAAAGLGIGLALSIGTARLLDGMLFGLKPLDLASYVIATTALGAVTLAAAAIPAWRASRLDPALALRRE